MKTSPGTTCSVNLTADGSYALALHILPSEPIVFLKILIEINGNVLFLEFKK
jgi:hypothetical protein